MATQSQIDFAERLYEERGMTFNEEAFAALDVADASAEIDEMLDNVESLPITEEQEQRILELTEKLGPRRDGKPWEIPTDRGRAAAFIANLERWVRGKEYGERREAARARLVAQGVAVKEPELTAPVSAPVANVADDDIPF